MTHVMAIAMDVALLADVEPVVMGVTTEASLHPTEVHTLM